MLTFVAYCAFLFNGEPQAVAKSCVNAFGLPLND
jgi:hypothetical protein